MTFASSRTREWTLMETASATTFDHARPLVVPGALHRAAVVVGDLLGVVGLVLCVPLAILAFGIPIALCVRFLLWLVGML